MRKEQFDDLVPRKALMIRSSGKIFWKELELKIQGEALMF